MGFVLELWSACYYFIESSERNDSNLFSDLASNLFSDLACNLFSDLASNLFTGLASNLFTDLASNLFSVNDLLWVSNLWIAWDIIFFIYYSFLFRTSSVTSSVTCSVTCWFQYSEVWNSEVWILISIFCLFHFRYLIK